MASLVGGHTWHRQSVTSATYYNLFHCHAIRHHLTPGITGRAGITDMERELLAFPTRLGGMGIPNPTNPNLQQAMAYGSEKGVSHWLAVIPLTKHGFTLHKGAFRDAINLW